MFQFVTAVNSGKIYWVDLIPKNIKSFDILLILYSKPLREYIKSKNEIGDLVRVSKYDLPFWKDYQPHSTLQVFEIVAIFFPVNLQHTQ